ncbi:MAG: hypothetical protein LOY03_07090 [Cyclobacteriaceae bacterium]|jgi:hypothetical protein|nr:hypothetical protein [Cyclobacteriaceae bacterium]
MRVIALLIAISTLLSFDEPKLKRTRVSDDISILVPVGWRPMDELDFSQRYPSVRAPIAAFTDQDRLVDVSVNVSATQWPDANVALASQFFKASILNTFDRVSMISEGIREIRGKSFIYFEFESTVRGNPRELGQEAPIMGYSYIQYLVQPGRTLVFSFHCPRRMKDAWQETALKIMENIRVK